MKKGWAIATEMIGRIIACIVILVLGVSALMFLTNQREEPAQAITRERAIQADLMTAEPKDVQVNIVGYGPVRSRDVVTIAPEIAGRVTEIHPKLEVGEVIPEGEVLFAIDPRDYTARLKDAAATTEQLEMTVERLELQAEIDEARLETLERSRDLARSEFERVRRLYEQDDVGTQSAVDAAERAWNLAEDQYDQLSQAVQLYPIRIQEANQQLASARAMRELAQVNADRTVVRAPFNARVKAVRLEADQYVSPGMDVLTLADDSVLEISVPLDSRVAREWLQFNAPSGVVVDAQKAWFGNLKPVDVSVYWTEADDTNASWTGRLDRVEEFDPETRQLTVVVQVQGSEAQQNAAGLPLVEGMFVKTVIPGKIAPKVVAVPAEAVGFDQQADEARTIFVAVPDAEGDLRLQRRRVVESHIEEGFVYLSSGVEPGELIITTRLVNPLENSLIETVDETTDQPADEPAEESAA